MSEEEKRQQDAEAAKDEFKRVIENLIESKVPWTKLFNKTELNQGRNETKWMLMKIYGESIRRHS